MNFIIFIVVIILIVILGAIFSWKWERIKNGYYKIKKKVANLKFISEEEYKVLIKYDPINERLYKNYEGYLIYTSRRDRPNKP
jgi:uncharacterized protein YxeA